MLYELGVLLAIATFTFANAVPQQCVCPFLYDPMCGTDGHTYMNLCHLRCEQRINPSLRLLHPGKCREDVCQCAVEYNPMCGSNGRNYANPCLLKCAQRTDRTLHLLHPGRCRVDECLCTMDYTPVCGVDHVTHANLCHLECVGVELAYNGEC